MKIYERIFPNRNIEKKGSLSIFTKDIHIETKMGSTGECMNQIQERSFSKERFQRGKEANAFTKLGSFCEKGKTIFSVWAPRAQAVYVIGDWNDWKLSEENQMQQDTQSGIWTTEISKELQYQYYKYAVVNAHGEIVEKSDPYARTHELRPNDASIVWGDSDFQWTDEEWLIERKKRERYEKCPLHIYELHLGSWRRNPDGTFRNYREIADALVLYLQKYPFTHVELLPIAEHPLDQSWGYQSTGYFSVTSRYGSPTDFQYFVNELHKNRIGVLLDFVPGHFCKDLHGLYMFDGTATYEYNEPSIRENAMWGTANFDLGKGEVQSFLLSGINYWITEYHIDGFRLDAVSNILYHHYPEYPSFNATGFYFLQQLNDEIHRLHPDILMTAEDSTDFQKITHKTEVGGVGFDLKWNMGWMNDILAFMEADENGRESLYDNLSFPMVYNETEKFILPLSHDEVVYGKRSLLNKMPGNYFEKFAQLKVLFGLFYTYPGKKLLFMGGEFAQLSEWNSEKELEWFLTKYPMHIQFQTFTSELMQIYQNSEVLWRLDHTNEGFQWIDGENRKQKVFSYLRKGENHRQEILVICNFSHVHYEAYRLGLPASGKVKEIISSDRKKYGGSGVYHSRVIPTEEISSHYFHQSVKLTIPAYSFMMFRFTK